MSRPRLPRSFFDRDVLTVAPELLGCTLSHAGVSVRLTEVEAYAGYRHDPGSHAYRGQTPRTAPMFGPAGFTYVYFTYGMHWCLNLVTGPVGSAQAVLIRGGEVVEGQETAALRRPGIVPRDWCRGPARLATTLALTGADSGLDFCRPALGERTTELTVRAATVPVNPVCVRTGPRVGVAGAGGDVEAYPWRFWLDGEPTVSTYRPGKPRVRRGS
jgi:DNA-3-methyladenine glycosylase